MIKKKLPYKKVRVIWVDICSSSQWYDDLADVDKFSYSWCEDIGYLYYKDSKVVKISIGNITAYPRSVVKKILYEK